MTARGLALAILIALGPATAAAQPAPGGGAVRKKLLLAPLATLGSESRSSDVKRTEKLVAASLAGLGDHDLVPVATALAAVTRARRPELRTCEGVATCLAELGALVGADLVVYGELGGLGNAQVVYLKLVEVAGKRELRSTTLELGGGDHDAAARASATRLIAPARYVGSLTLDIAVAGTSVYVDGKKTATKPGAPIALAVGSHALRVTHPEYRDFVRFVEVGFGVGDKLVVPLERYAVVDRELSRAGGAQVGAAGREVVVPAPWYRRWYVTGGGGALLLITSALIVGAVVDGIDTDDKRELP